MAAVLAQVQCNPIGPGPFTEKGKLDTVRLHFVAMVECMLAVAGLSHRCTVIYIQPEEYFFRSRAHKSSYSQLINLIILRPTQRTGVEFA